MKLTLTKLRANYSNFREKAKEMATERDSLLRENKMIKRQLSEEREDNQNIGDMYLKILEILKISFDDPDRAKHLFNLSLQPTEEEMNETRGLHECSHALSHRPDSGVDVFQQKHQGNDTLGTSPLTHVAASSIRDSTKNDEPTCLKNIVDGDREPQ